MSNEPVTIRGRVVGEDGHPVEGALARVGISFFPRMRAGARPDETLPTVERTATTDADGRFEIGFGTVPDGAVGANLRVWAEKCDRVSSDHDLQLAPGPLDVPDLTLREAILPAFQLADCDGAPVAGALGFLEADRPGGRRDLLRSAEYVLWDRSDEEGILRFPPIPRRDDWTLRLEGGHPAGAVCTWSVPVEDLLAGEPVSIGYLWGLRVRGRLVGPDGEPRGGLSVRAERPWDPMPRQDREECLSGPDGSFFVTGVPSEGGAILVQLTPPSGRPFGDPPTIPWRIAGIRGGEGEEIDMGEVRLAPSGPISGTVVHGTRPVAGARMKARRTGEGGIGANAWSDEEGRFRFDGLPPGTYTLSALDPSSRRQGVKRDVAIGSEGIVLRLGESRGAAGRGRGRPPE